ncbi:MAG: SRPBCC family protein [Cyclobacteriaceae bacterium]
MKLISSVEINKNRQSVWNLLNDPSLFPQWQKGYESTVQLSGSPGEEGARAQHVFNESGKKFTFTEEVLESQEPEKILVTLDSDVMTYRIETTLEELGEQTRVTMTAQTTMKAFSFKILSPFLSKSFQKRQDEDLRRFKELAESEERA